MFSKVEGGQKGFGVLLTFFKGQAMESVVRSETWSVKTILVAGRRNYEMRHQTTVIPGRSGAVFQGIHREEREIELTVAVSGRSSQDFLQAVAGLEAFFWSKKPGRLSFSDESPYYYEGQVKSIQVKEEKRGDGLVEVRLVCYQPYRYRDLAPVSGTSIRYAGSIPTKPVITLRLTAGGSELRLLHVEKQQYIRLAGPGLVFTAGNTIVIDTEAGTITQNGRSILPFLDMVNSRFFSFSSGVNTLQSSLAGSVSSQYREVYA